MTAPAGGGSTSRGPRVIVALDFDKLDDARRFAEHMDPAACRMKVGKELFTAVGPAVVEYLVGRGFDVFLDLKFHDIPHTVGRACRMAASLGVWMINVHALGGRRMLEAAAAAVANLACRPLMTGVTILTSLDQTDLAEIGLHGEVSDHVVRLARLARDAGLDGVVCSSREAPLLRAATAPDFVLVTPGIRPQGHGSDDQKRVMTPAQAIHVGADYLVIGRPLTEAPDPVAVLAAINADIDRSLVAHQPAG